MKNYYEILEVNPRASKEVIEKAYKVLAKKYHPDLYTGEKQQYAERKIKEINAAYNILSDEFLREQYDNQMRNQEQSKKEQRKQKPKVGTFGSMFELTKGLIQDLAKSKEKRQEIKEMTKTDILAIILTIIVLVIIGIILWFIPFTNRMDERIII